MSAVAVPRVPIAFLGFIFVVGLAAATVVSMWDPTPWKLYVQRGTHWVYVDEFETEEICVKRGYLKFKEPDKDPKWECRYMPL